MKTTITLALAATLITTAVWAADQPAAPADQKLVPLKLDLPKPMFVGTPVPVKLPNMEQPTGQKRPDFMVPEGTVNVAAKKTVTSSDPAPVIGELELITNGDKEGADGSYVELGPQLQWVQIDLGAPTTLFVIFVWHYHAQARAYHDVIVQVSDDPDFVTGVKTLYNNDHDNSAGLGIGKDKAYIETSEGRLIDAKGVTARYVRLSSKGNTSNEMNHYIEVEVYGQPAKR